METIEAIVLKGDTLTILGELATVAILTSGKVLAFASTIKDKIINKKAISLINNSSGSSLTTLNDFLKCFSIYMNSIL